MLCTHVGSMLNRVMYAKICDFVTWYKEERLIFAQTIVGNFHMLKDYKPKF
jgi:hypothetical protein